MREMDGWMDGWVVVGGKERGIGTNQIKLNLDG